MNTNPLDPESWRRLSAMLDDLLDLEESERRRKLKELAAEDPNLHRKLEGLLAHDSEPTGWLDRPLGEWAGSLLEDLGEITGDGRNEFPPSGCERIGPWVLGRRLGHGGMGTVYLAERDDGHFQQQVALKLLNGQDHDGELARRMGNERRILAQLDHPHIARLQDGGVTASGMPWFAMELVDGEPITSYCDEHQLTISQRIKLFLEVCEAVSWAHGHLVVHRDLKPSNIMVSRRGEVKLVDFGIATILQGGEQVDPRLTRTRGQPMTPRYAAPEQIRGEPVSTATDVYALGVVLYELLTGHSPHGPPSSSEHELEKAILQVDPEPLGRAVFRPLVRTGSDGTAQEVTAETLGSGRGGSPQKLHNELKGDLNTIVAKALRKDPARRFRSVEALGEDLVRYLTGLPVKARRPTVGYRFSKYVRRHRMEIAGSILVFSLLSAGLAGTIWQARKASRQAERAEKAKEFLVQMFSQAGPDRSEGRELTARQMLVRGVEQIQRDLDAEPELAAELLLTVGSIQLDLGHFAPAESVLTMALARTREAYGPRSLETAKALNVLGTCLHEQGQFEQAAIRFGQALELAEDLGGPMHPETLAALSNLAGSLRRRGDVEGAIEAYREVLDMSLKAFGKDYDDLDTDMNNLAVSLGAGDRYAEAESVHAIVVEMRRTRLGELHPDVSISLHNRATGLSKLGRDAEAESLWAECIRLRHIIYPDGHPDLASSYTSLAMHYRDLGRLDEAEDLLEQAVAMHRKINPDPHFELARTINSLGITAYSRGDFDKAARYLGEALEIWEATEGAEGFSTLRTMNNLGVVLHRAGRLDEARPILEEVCAIRLRVLGPDHSDLAYSYKGLGMLAADQGQVAEADSLLGRALDFFSDNLAADHQLIAEINLGLGMCRMAEGRTAEADSLLQAAHQVLAARYDPEHPLVVKAERSLASLEEMRRDR